MPLSARSLCRTEVGLAGSGVFPRLKFAGLHQFVDPKCEQHGFCPDLISCSCAPCVCRFVYSADRPIIMSRFNLSWARAAELKHVVRTGDFSKLGHHVLCRCDSLSVNSCHQMSMRALERATAHQRPMSSGRCQHLPRGHAIAQHPSAPTSGPHTARSCLQHAPPLLPLNPAPGGPTCGGRLSICSRSCLAISKCRVTACTYGLWGLHGSAIPEAGHRVFVTIRHDWLWTPGPRTGKVGRVSRMELGFEFRK